jgi:hypothetical protein
VSAPNEAHQKAGRGNQLRTRHGHSAVAAKEMGKIAHLLRAEVGRHPVVHPAALPMQKVVAVVRGALDRALGAVGSRPHEDVHDMFAALVDQRRHRAAGEVVQSAADEAETVGGEVINRRREIDSPVEPRLDRMLVGRDR